MLRPLMNKYRSKFLFTFTTFERDDSENSQNAILNLKNPQNLPNHKPVVLCLLWRRMTLMSFAADDDNDDIKFTRNSLLMTRNFRLVVH